MLNPMLYAEWRRLVLASPGQSWLVPHFLPANSMTMICGRPKYGRKSWIGYMLAWAAASGQTIGPFAPTGSYPTLYIDLEGNEHEAAKRPDLLRAGNMPIPDMDGHPMWQAHGQIFQLHNPSHLQRLRDFVQSEGIKLVFIDTFSRAACGVEENSAKEIGRLVLALKEIQMLGCTVVIIHHLRKGYRHEPGEPIDASAGLRGSGALEGAFDHIVSATRAKVDDEVRSFWVVGGKFYDYAAFTVEWQFSQDEYAKLVAAGPHAVPVTDSTRPHERGAFGGRM